ncbi:MAG: hypothetical protein V3T72_22890 [Thermoanaerobaculia bacterium]
MAVEIRHRADPIPPGSFAAWRPKLPADPRVFEAALDGAYAEPERLPPQVNTGRDRFNAFIAADESFLILPIFGRDDSLGGRPEREELPT